ncbi:UNKNOWN [Stylonychia lemnae]|uniref:Uncharacterized protein n=1 Tax=Stylonychia lemnae TaxID=5949 RepID=A0A077ZS16_STYLE|nr:UNKNOWN [Stylonychia lemnae]|eukprot:CDW72279.1 UNKNOWN [Stylonychia lemnae]
MLTQQNGIQTLYSIKISKTQFTPTSPSPYALVAEKFQYKNFKSSIISFARVAQYGDQYFFAGSFLESGRYLGFVTSSKNEFQCYSLLSLVTSPLLSETFGSMIRWYQNSTNVELQPNVKNYTIVDLKFNQDLYEFQIQLFDSDPTNTCTIKIGNYSISTCTDAYKITFDLIDLGTNELISDPALSWPLVQPSMNCSYCVKYLQYTLISLENVHVFFLSYNNETGYFRIFTETPELKNTYHKITLQVKAITLNNYDYEELYMLKEFKVTLMEKEVKNNNPYFAVDLFDQYGMSGSTTQYTLPEGQDKENNPFTISYEVSSKAAQKFTKLDGNTFTFSPSKIEYGQFEYQVIL